MLPESRIRNLRAATPFGSSNGGDVGYLIAGLLLVVILAVLAMAAFKRPPRTEPAREPEKEGTSYEEPLDEGRA
jgi:hypothetical protein